MTAFDDAWAVVKATPLKWINTTAGKKWLGLGHTPSDDYAQAFRSLATQYRGKPGMMNIQRRLSGKGKSPVTIEAANMVPLMDPRFTINRRAQHDAWYGNKRYREGARKPSEGGTDKLARGPGRTLHADAGGRLPLSEAQMYLLGDAHPGDIHDFDTSTDAKGSATVVDEHGGQPPLITYWPFTRDKEGQITYRDDKTTGSGDWVMIPHEGADPIPLPDGYRHEGLGIVAPRGIYLPRGL